MFTLKVTYEAELEIAKVFLWYEEQSNGLGTEFLRALDVCLSFIERQPMMYPIVYKQLRRGIASPVPIPSNFHSRRELNIRFILYSHEL